MSFSKTIIRARTTFKREFSTPTANNATSSLQTISTCPKPTRTCAATPPDLDIDRKHPLNGTMAAYRHHAIVRTGVSDWTSRIEDDQRHPVVQAMKKEFGRGGKYHDPFNHTLLSASSHSSQDPSILLFPSFQAISSPSLISVARSNDRSEAVGEVVDALIERYLFSSQHTTGRKAASDPETFDFVTTPIQHLTVLICGHGARDSRCGIMGSVLEKQFRAYLKQDSWSVDEFGSSLHSSQSNNDAAKTATVELISHVGGHKYAGNVIVYFPRTDAWNCHPLAGKGIWYGRVEPSHVDGIMKETVGKGIIIEELFRGGVGENGEILRL